MGIVAILGRNPGVRVRYLKRISVCVEVMERDLHGYYARYRELFKSVFLIPDAVMSLALPDGKTLRILMDAGRIVEVL